MNAVAMWGLLACARPEAPADTGPAPDTDVEVIGDTEDTDTAPPDDTGLPDDRVYEALFDPAAVGRIDLELTEEALASLRDDPDTYVRATFVHERVASLEDIGVRLKGGASTFDDIDGKPSFKLKLDAFEALDYGGLTKLNLHNMKADAAQAREVVAAAVWEAAGVPAPRASYVEVYVNGVSRGLYANVEEVDGAFVARRFTDGRGDLWEAE
ncbi:MAG: CotH kinase family protein, partial [Myxococcota bacterium]